MSATSSANERRSSRENAENLTKAQSLKEANDRLENDRRNGPVWTAVITFRGNKTLKSRWVRTDSVNNKIF